MIYKVLWGRGLEDHKYLIGMLYFVATIIDGNWLSPCRASGRYVCRAIRDIDSYKS